MIVSHDHYRRQAQHYRCLSGHSLNRIYHDRIGLTYHRNNPVHHYYDRYHRRCDQIIWPQYHYPVSYRFGYNHHVRHVYPFYHRKYVFVSLGGHWPSNYGSLRYYWYGWHPYTWYGYSPIPYEVQGDTNYYTYNIVQSSDGPVSVDPRLDDVPPLPAEPMAQGPADVYFERAVQAFETGLYATAASYLRNAMGVDTRDVIIPFAYAQALFASKQYRAAVDALRHALANISVEQATVFYPRGLYKEDDVLFDQVDELIDYVQMRGADPGLQLLLGYQLLGIGETDYALEPLNRSLADPQNSHAAGILIDLLAKINAQQAAEASQTPTAR